MNGTSRRIPPEKRNESSFGSPMTISAPSRERMMSSIPWRSSVPGAIRWSAASSSGSRRGSSSDGVRVKPRAACASGITPQFVRPQPASSGSGVWTRPPPDRRDDQPGEDAACSGELEPRRRLVDDQRREDHRQHRLQASAGSRSRPPAVAAASIEISSQPSDLRREREQDEPAGRRPGRRQVEVADDGADRRADDRRRRASR